MGTNKIQQGLCNLLWRFTLREGLRFHDGTPVRAADCVASLRRWGRSFAALGVNFRGARLTLDLQVSVYVLATGMTVVYDVLRKLDIEPKKATKKA
mgnify:CR=1 FL=1